MGHLFPANKKVPLSYRKRHRKWNWFIFQNEIILQDLAPSQLVLGVAGRHRACPSVSLDNVPYEVVCWLGFNSSGHSTFVK